jgi:hypothetical protein
MGVVDEKDRGRWGGLHMGMGAIANILSYKKTLLNGVVGGG